MFKLTIHTDTTAFRDGKYSGDELARILHNIAGLFRGVQVEDEECGNIRDSNAITVGMWEVTEDAD